MSLKYILYTLFSTIASRHLDTLFLCTDGNFKLINLTKKNNAQERSLWDGRGYLCAKLAVDAHANKFDNIHIEVSCLFMRAFPSDLSCLSIERGLSGIRCRRECEHIKVSEAGS